MSLPLDCLTRDASGAPVLIYDNLKRDREGRRLPVSEHTAAVITAQQERVTGRYPATPRSGLALLPTPKLNPGGSKNITVDRLEERHREWVTSLGPLRTADGDRVRLREDRALRLPAHLRPKARRRRRPHRRARRAPRPQEPQRHPRVLPGRRRPPPRRRRQGHRDELRPARQPDLARRPRPARRPSTPGTRSAQVAVPYGTCTEPSNVAAGGGACPVRFRCAGCDHFRTVRRALSSCLGQRRHAAIRLDLRVASDLCLASSFRRVHLIFFSPAGWQDWDVEREPLIRSGMPVLIEDDLRLRTTPARGQARW